VSPRVGLDAVEKVSFLLVSCWCLASLILSP
jgi:hypothetical protein